MFVLPFVVSFVVMHVPSRKPWLKIVSCVVSFILIIFSLVLSIFRVILHERFSSYLSSNLLCRLCRIILLARWESQCLPGFFFYPFCKSIIREAFTVSLFSSNVIYLILLCCYIFPALFFILLAKYRPFLHISLTFCLSFLLLFFFFFCFTDH